MKMDFVCQNDSENFWAIRLSEFTTQEAESLSRSILSMARIGDSIQVNELEFVEAPDCRLELQVGSRDRGIITTRDPNAYLAIMTLDGWDNVAGLMEPFLNGSTGYQWLIQNSCGPLLLISPNGEW